MNDKSEDEVFKEMVALAWNSYPPYKSEWKCTKEEYDHFRNHNPSIGCAECERIDKLLKESGFD